MVRWALGFFVMFVGAAILGVLEADAWDPLLFLLAPVPFGLIALRIVMPELERHDRRRRAIR